MKQWLKTTPKWKLALIFVVGFFLLNGLANMTARVLGITSAPTAEQRLAMRCRDIHGSLDQKPIAQLSLKDLGDLRNCREFGL